MSSPCNNLNVVPIKVSKLVRYKNIDANDFFLTIESGSGLFSRKSTFGDLVNAFGDVTGSYSGSFSGSYWGRIYSKNTIASGSFNGKMSGSFSGSIKSKNTKASGSFNGIFVGNNSKISGSFSGKLSGSFSGSIKSKNTKATGSFNGNFIGNNSKLSGSFNGKLSGSFSGSIISKKTTATGSFSGSYWGRIYSKNTFASGSFSGSLTGKIISTGIKSRITGSFKGINNILNFKGSGKGVSVNATSSYSISSSYATTSSYVTDGGFIFANGSYTQKTGDGTPSTGAGSGATARTFASITVPTGKKIKWFRLEGSFNVSENQGVALYGLNWDGTLLTTNIYSSWGWGNGYEYDPDSKNIQTHFTIEGKPGSTVTGTIPIQLFIVGTTDIHGYAVAYY